MIRKWGTLAGDCLFYLWWRSKIFPDCSQMDVLSSFFHLYVLCRPEESEGAGRISRCPRFLGYLLQVTLSLVSRKTLELQGVALTHQVLTSARSALEGVLSAQRSSVRSWDVNWGRPDGDGSAAKALLHLEVLVLRSHRAVCLQVRMSSSPTEGGGGTFLVLCCTSRASTSSTSPTSSTAPSPQHQEPLGSGLAVGTRQWSGRREEQHEANSPLIQKIIISCQNQEGELFWGVSRS